MSLKLFGILFLSLVICQPLLSQKKKKKKEMPQYYIGVFGGYFSHGEIFKNSKDLFSGIQTFHIEYTKKFLNNKIGVGLDFMNQTSDVKLGFLINEQARNAVMLYGKQSKKIIKTKKTATYLGGYGGFLYDRGWVKPKVNLAFPINTRYLGVVIGPELEFEYLISPKVTFNILGKISLAEVGNRKEEGEDPNLPKKVQTISESYFYFGQRINFNIGFGVKL